MSKEFGKSVCIWTAIAVWMCAAPAAAQPAAEANRFAVLVFTKTGGFRHDSIPAGITAIRSLGNEHGFTVVNSEEASVFNEADLDVMMRVKRVFNPNGLLNPAKIFPSRRGCTEIGKHTTTSTAEIGKRVEEILLASPSGRGSSAEIAREAQSPTGRRLKEKLRD